MHIITRLRNALRRWLGLEHWEELQLSELRNLRKEVTGLLRSVRYQRTSLANVRSEVEAHGIQLLKLTEDMEQTVKLDQTLKPTHSWRWVDDQLRNMTFAERQKDIAEEDAAKRQKNSEREEEYNVGREIRRANIMRTIEQLQKRLEEI